MSGFDDLFKNLKAGEQIPGGCDTCDAFQTIETLTPGVHVIHVNHDDWCPTLRAMKAMEN